MNIKNPTIEERALLEKLDIKTLLFMDKIFHEKDFFLLVDLFAKIKNLEKNLFFDEKEWEPIKLALKHKYSIGRIDGVASMFRLMFGAVEELSKRKNEK